MMRLAILLIAAVGIGMAVTGCSAPADSEPPVTQQGPSGVTPDSPAGANQAATSGGTQGDSGATAPSSSGALPPPP
jgi:hypothetical protein